MVFKSRLWSSKIKPIKNIHLDKNTSLRLGVKDACLWIGKALCAMRHEEDRWLACWGDNDMMNNWIENDITVGPNILKSVMFFDVFLQHF